jgi:hypothetical protein
VVDPPFKQLPSLVNVSSLLGLVLFIYSVLGVQLYTYMPRGAVLTDERNFDHFGNAVLTNLQALTGDGWSTMMKEVRHHLEGQAGDVLMADFFFVSFQLLCSSVILNLIVAVILENFTSLGNANQELVSRDGPSPAISTSGPQHPHTLALLTSRVRSSRVGARPPSDPPPLWTRVRSSVAHVACSLLRWSRHRPLLGGMGPLRP